MKQALESLLNEVSKSPVVDNGDLKAASRLILESVMAGLNVKRCGIWLYQDDLSGISCFFLIDDHLHTIDESLVLLRKDYPSYFAALDEARTIAVDDACTAVETSEFAQGYLDVLGITSMLDTPIRHSGKTVGVICSEHRGVKRQWQEDEMVFAGVLSDLFGRAISAREKLDIEKELIETNHNLEALVAKRTEYLLQSMGKMQELQKQLLESEKLASLGNMVAGIAHEVNTPLGIALTSISFIKDSHLKIANKFSSNTMTRDCLNTFLSSTKNAIELSEENLYRAATLISNFKKTSADQNHFEHESVNIKTYIEKVLSTVIPITKKKSVQIYTLGDDVEKYTQPGAIAQVIINLVSNSCEHGFEKVCDDPTIKIAVKSVAEDKTEIIYRDNGCGIKPEDLKKVFEPFYTTKRAQGGTGLGLSISHTLVTQTLNGTISVDSNEGGGTEFRLVF